MNEPELSLLNVKGLIKKLNSELNEVEGEIELGSFQLKPPRKNPFLYRLANRRAENIGKYNLYLIGEGGGLLSGFSGLDAERKIGYIFVENGAITESTDFPGKYEALRLRIKEPLTLKNGLVVPNCSVKILIEQEDGIDAYKERKDHTRTLGLLWRRSDLSRTLPTGWFLNF